MFAEIWIIVKLFHFVIVVRFENLLFHGEDIAAKSKQSLMGSLSIGRRLCEAIVHAPAQSCTRNQVRGTNRIQESWKAKT